MLVVHATLPILPEKRDEFLGAVGGLIEETNKEPGVRSYALYESIATPNTFLMFEEYDDEDAFNAHLGSPHFQAAGAGLAGWLSGPPKIVKHQAEEGSEVAIG